MLPSWFTRVHSFKLRNGELADVHRHINQQHHDCAFLQPGTFADQLRWRPPFFSLRKERQRQYIAFTRQEDPARGRFHRILVFILVKTSSTLTPQGNFQPSPSDVCAAVVDKNFKKRRRPCREMINPPINGHCPLKDPSYCRQHRETGYAARR